jgi:hypothetical protein
MSNDVSIVMIPAHWNANDYDGRWIPEKDEEEDRKYFNFPEVEGSTSPLLDWMLVDQRFLVRLYYHYSFPVGIVLMCGRLACIRTRQMISGRFADSDSFLQVVLLLCSNRSCISNRWYCSM